MEQENSCRGPRKLRNASEVLRGLTVSRFTPHGERVEVSGEPGLCLCARGGGSLLPVELQAHNVPPAPAGAASRANRFTRRDRCMRSRKKSNKVNSRGRSVATRWKLRPSF